MSRRIFLTGPTASGKGSVAYQLAGILGGEVVVVDSMKVYREMDIGTAKPSVERRSRVPYHMVDMIDPAHNFSVGEYLPLALQAIEEIERRGRPVILCGGTALYLNAMVHGLFCGPGADWELRGVLMDQCDARGTAEIHALLAREDPAAARKIHPNDRRRIVRALEVRLRTGMPLTELWQGRALRLEPESLFFAGMGWDRQELYRRIDARVLRMVREGLLPEARKLFQRSGGIGRAARQCIGYKEIFWGDRQGMSEAEIIARIQQRTRRFAKQQLTWFRRFPIRWFEPGKMEDSEALAKRILVAWPGV